MVVRRHDFPVYDKSYICQAMLSINIYGVDHQREDSTLGFLAEISFTPLLYHPGGCLGCPEKKTRSRNYNLFVWSAVFQQKRNDIQKTYKNHQNPVKSYFFLGYFQSLFNFG